MINTKNRSVKFLSALAALFVLISALVSCTPGASGGDGTTGSVNAEVYDYAAKVSLDLTSTATLKQQVTVHAYIDGDTTHFNVPKSVSETGVLKARYLAVNTPESTGKIEEYGKAASNYTKAKLKGASSIVIESDNGSWNLDSTGARHLVWVWYRESETDAYRNLNIELLQNGLAIASSSANNRYGDICMAAIAQAKTQKLNIYSGQKDPDFYYGDAVELTLKELRCNIEQYNGIKVAFEGIITNNSNSGVYIESYDEETGRSYGIYVYYGYGLSGEGLDILSVGNLSRIVGSVQYYEAGGTYQVSGLTYRQMRPDDPSNIKKISDGHTGAYTAITAAELSDERVTLTDNEGNAREYSAAELMLSTTVSMSSLKVTSVYTTTSDASSQKGALTLTCTSPDGATVSVRTAVLTDDDGNVIKAEAYEGKTINVRGIVDLYDGRYQIKVLTAKNIDIVN